MHKPFAEVRWVPANLCHCSMLRWLDYGVLAHKYHVQNDLNCELLLEIAFAGDIVDKHWIHAQPSPSILPNVFSMLAEMSIAKFAYIFKWKTLAKLRFLNNNNNNNKIIQLTSLSNWIMNVGLTARLTICSLVSLSPPTSTSISSWSMLSWLPVNYFFLCVRFKSYEC